MPTVLTWSGRISSILYRGRQSNEVVRESKSFARLSFQHRATDYQIIAGKVRYPTYFDLLAKELLKNLLVGDLTKRYGNLRAGSSDIFAHGWFAEVDWDKLYRREIPAPYVPKIEGEGDASQ